jgi:hypothetical protein
VRVTVTRLETRTAFPCPKQPKPATAPGDDGFWSDDDESRLPVVPDEASTLWKKTS